MWLITISQPLTMVRGKQESGSLFEDDGKIYDCGDSKPGTCYTASFLLGLNTIRGSVTGENDIDFLFFHYFIPCTC